MFSYLIPLANSIFRNYPDTQNLPGLPVEENHGDVDNMRGYPNIFLLLAPIAGSMAYDHPENG
jgi:hypothetical protein